MKSIPLVILLPLQMIQHWCGFLTSFELFSQLFLLFISELLLDVIELHLLQSNLILTILSLLLFLVLEILIILNHNSFISLLFLMELLTSSSLHLNLLLRWDKTWWQGTSCIQFIVSSLLVKWLLMLDELSGCVSFIRNVLISRVTFEDKTFSVVELVTILLLLLLTIDLVDISLIS